MPTGIQFLCVCSFVTFSEFIKGFGKISLMILFAIVSCMKSQALFSVDLMCFELI